MVHIHANLISNSWSWIRFILGSWILFLWYFDDVDYGIACILCSPLQLCEYWKRWTWFWVCQWKFCKCFPLNNLWRIKFWKNRNKSTTIISIKGPLKYCRCVLIFPAHFSFYPSSTIGGALVKYHYFFSNVGSNHTLAEVFSKTSEN